MSQVRDEWQKRLAYELRFWDDYLRTRGLTWRGEYSVRINPNAPLTESQIVSRIPKDQTHVRILDVGSGPMTALGKLLPGKTVEITAADPLADDYAKLLEQYKVKAPLKTVWCEGEGLAKKFPADSFDFVYARNALDHAHDPVRMLDQMLRVVKYNGWVILRHHPNKAESNGYQGLSRWNVRERDGRFELGSKSETRDMTAELNHIAAVECHSEGPWLVCAIRRRPRWERRLRRLLRKSRPAPRPTPLKP